MAAVSPARAVALTVMSRQRRRSGRARELLREERSMAALGPKGKALAMRLVLGANVAAGELDRRIDAVAKRPKAMEPRVRDALRLACFELLYLDTPCQVAVSQGVELVRSVQPRAAGMANAVLRRVASARPEVDAARGEASRLAGYRRGVEASLPLGPSATNLAAAPSLVQDKSGCAAMEPECGAASASVLCSVADVASAPLASKSDLSCVEAENELVDALCLASGYPQWLVGRFVRELGLADAAAICDAALEPAPVYVAEGPVCEGPLASLDAAGPLDAAPCALPGSWVLGSPAPLLESGLVETCSAVPCDLGAQCVCRIAVPGKGRMLEVGQGRGTKSLLLAGIAHELGGDECHLAISGCDSVASKVRISRARMRAAGLYGTVSCNEFDATGLGGPDDLPPELAGEFDAVLVDAPCSGTGTMRRHPEIPWSLRESALDPSSEDSLPALQLRLLEAAAARVAPGGALCYATCSVLEGENEAVVEAFLASASGRGFARASIMDAPAVSCLGSDARSFIEDRLTPEGSFQSVPARGGCDGHFCVRLVRVR